MLWRLKEYESKRYELSSQESCVFDKFKRKA